MLPYYFNTTGVGRKVHEIYYLTAAIDSYPADTITLHHDPNTGDGVGLLLKQPPNSGLDTVMVRERPRRCLLIGWIFGGVIG